MFGEEAVTKRTFINFRCAEKWGCTFSARSVLILLLQLTPEKFKFCTKSMFQQKKLAKLGKNTKNLQSLFFSYWDIFRQCWKFCVNSLNAKKFVLKMCTSGKYFLSKYVFRKYNIYRSLYLREPLNWTNGKKWWHCLFWATFSPSRPPKQIKSVCCLITSKIANMRLATFW